MAVAGRVPVAVLETVGGGVCDTAGAVRLAADCVIRASAVNTMSAVGRASGRVGRAVGAGGGGAAQAAISSVSSNSLARPGRGMRRL